MKLTGQIQLAQLDAAKPMERQFRDAWDKKHGNGVLDDQFKIVVTSGNAMTTLTSLRDVESWADKMKTGGPSMRAVKATASPEVKLVLQRELGALALRDLDRQIAFDLDQYNDTMTNQNAVNSWALNSRRVDYNVMMDSNMMDKVDQMMSQIDAMVDAMFAQATDHIFGLLGLFLAVAGCNKSVPRTTDEGAGLMR